MSVDQQQETSQQPEPTSNQESLLGREDAIENAIAKLREEADPKLVSILNGVNAFVHRNQLRFNTTAEEPQGIMIHYFRARNAQGRDVVMEVTGRNDAEEEDIRRLVIDEVEGDILTLVENPKQWDIERTRGNTVTYVSDPLTHLDVRDIDARNVAVLAGDSWAPKNFYGHWYDSRSAFAGHEHTNRGIMNRKVRDIVFRQDRENPIDPLAEGEKQLSMLSQAQYVGHRIFSSGAERPLIRAAAPPLPL